VKIEHEVVMNLHVVMTIVHDLRFRGPTVASEERLLGLPRPDVVFD